MVDGEDGDFYRSPLFIRTIPALSAVLLVFHNTFLPVFYADTWRGCRRFTVRDLFKAALAGASEHTQTRTVHHENGSVAADGERGQTIVEVIVDSKRGEFCAGE